MSDKIDLKRWEVKIEGVPEGWELVRIGRAKGGDWYLDGDNEPRVLEAHETIGGSAIIRKIEPPKPTYVPWTYETCPIGCVVECLDARKKGMITGASDDGARVNGPTYSYEQLLDNWQQLDGTPCGTVEVAK